MMTLESPTLLPRQRSKRALRRHHRYRMIKHARSYLAYLNLPDFERRAVRVHDYLTACSCWMCGNPRNHRGERTLQEIREASLPLRGGVGRVEDWN